jgi:hypothetical protein
MNSFRHPANAKLFFIFAGQILAAFAIDRYLLNESFRKPLLKKIVLSVGALVILAFIISLIKSQLLSTLFSLISNKSSSAKQLLKDTLDNFSFYDLLLLNSFFLIVLLGITWVMIKKERLVKFFIPLMCLDMFISAQLMLPLTYVKKARVSEIQGILDKQPRGYPPPDIHASIEELSKDGELYFDKIGCLNPYNKKPGRSEYIITPSNPATQDLFWDNITLRKKIMQYPLAYFADTVFSVKDSSAFLSEHAEWKAALADINEPLPASLTDSSSIELIKFIPHKFTFKTTSSKKRLFVLLQNKYPRWNVEINGQPVTIHMTNTSFMGVIVPSGNNIIHFEYKAAHIPWLGLFSIIFALTGMIYFSTRKKNKTT